MPYALLANITLVVHALFILFVVFGAMLVFRWRNVAWLHLPCAVWGMLIEFQGWVCPLTYLENDLRTAAGSRGYTGGFIDHYLMPLVYPSGLTSAMQVKLGFGVLLINLVIYAMVWRIERKNRE